MAFRSVAIALLLWAASIGPITVLVIARISTNAMPQAIYTTFGIVYTVAYAVSLYYVFGSGRVTTFRFGWTVLLFFYGLLLFPVFWHMHVRDTPR